MASTSIQGGYGSLTVAKGLEILDILAGQKRPMTAAELARQLDMNTSSIYRVLATLVQYGYIQHISGTSTYFLGTKLLSLANVVLGHLDVRTVCRGTLEELMQKTGEATHLLMIDGNEGLYIERVASPHSIQMASNVGRREPLYASSVGKAIMAFMPPKELDRLIGATNFQRFTEKTITEPNELKKHLEEIKKRGYAIDDMEAEDGIRCIGAPVFDHEGKARYSISIAGPAYRLSMEKLHGFVPDLLEAARTISHNLGYNK